MCKGANGVSLLHEKPEGCVDMNKNFSEGNYRLVRKPEQVISALVRTIHALVPGITWLDLLYFLPSI